MINLKLFFRHNPYLLPVSKAEKDLLECFLDNKAAYENWLPFQQNRRIRFQFYYPTAIDFYFDDHKLFTAYFKRSAASVPELQQLKMTEANFSTIRSANWQPFEEVIMTFLNTLAENNKSAFFRKTKSLHEYAALCEGKPAQNEQPSQVIEGNKVFG